MRSATLLGFIVFGVVIPTGVDAQPRAREDGFVPGIPINFDPDVHDDRRDLDEIIYINEDWHLAVRRDDPRLLASVRRRLDKWLRRELRESRREVQKAQRDLRKARYYNSGFAGYRYEREDTSGLVRYSETLPDARLDLIRAEQDRQATEELAADVYELRHQTTYGGPAVYPEQAAVLDDLVDLSAVELMRTETGSALPDVWRYGQQ